MKRELNQVFSGTIDNRKRMKVTSYVKGLIKIPDNGYRTMFDI